ncbi:helix-turn-helix domain-containing protein [Lacinutrix chionoecetis]
MTLKFLFLCFMELNAELFKHIELLIGSMGVILALFFSMFLLSNRKQHPKANIFLALYLLAFSLRIGKSLFFNYFYIDALIRNVFLAVLLTIGPSLWFYVRLLYKPHLAIKKQIIWLHYVPFFMVVCLCWIIPNNGSTATGVFYMILIFHIVGYSIYSWFWLIKQNKTNLSARQEKIKKWLLYFVVVTLFMMVIYFLISKGVIPYYLGTAFLFSAVVILFALKALQNQELFKLENEKYSSSNLNTEELSIYVKKLNHLMTTERLYLNPELTLTMLSKRMKITSKTLSQIINQAYHCNYSQYIANFRVEAAKSMLSSSKFKHYKIAAIAYDSGFNSLSSFNSTFKKLTNTTAIKYRQIQSNS